VGEATILSGWATGSNLPCPCDFHQQVVAAEGTELKQARLLRRPIRVLAEGGLQPDYPGQMTLAGELPGTDFDTRLRQEAMAWLTVRTNDGADWLTREDVLDFKLDGETRRLQPTQQGIWKPRDLPAALSFQTVYRAPGKERPYNDEPGPDGMLRYAWRGDDPDQGDNRAMRAAMELQKPLIWFFRHRNGPRCISGDLSRVHLVGRAGEQAVRY
jgi:hypothetical protein